jgi:hypothetical protein
MHNDAAMLPRAAEQGGKPHRPAQNVRADRNGSFI